MNLLMGQQEIIDLLQENEYQWMSTRDISYKLGINSSTCCEILKRLRKSDHIYFKRMPGRIGARAPFLYRYKK